MRLLNLRIDFYLLWTFCLYTSISLFSNFFLLPSFYLSSTTSLAFSSSISLSPSLSLLILVAFLTFYSSLYQFLPQNYFVFSLFCFQSSRFSLHFLRVSVSIFICLSFFPYIFFSFSLIFLSFTFFTITHRIHLLRILRSRKK